MLSSTETLIKALRILAEDIKSDDGVANAAISEAADRLQQLYDHNGLLRIEFEKLAITAAQSADKNVELREQVVYLANQLERCQGDLASYANVNDIK